MIRKSMGRYDTEARVISRERFAAAEHQRVILGDYERARVGGNLSEYRLAHRRVVEMLADSGPIKFNGRIYCPDGCGDFERAKALRRAK